MDDVQNSNAVSIQEITPSYIDCSGIYNITGVRYGSRRI